MVHADDAGGKSVQRVRRHAPNLFTHAPHKLSISVNFFGGRGVKTPQWEASNHCHLKLTKQTGGQSIAPPPGRKHACFSSAPHALYLPPCDSLGELPQASKRTSWSCSGWRRRSALFNRMVEWKWRRALTCMFFTGWPVLTICRPPASHAPSLLPSLCITISLYVALLSVRICLSITLRGLVENGAQRFNRLFAYSWLSTIKVQFSKNNMIYSIYSNN